MRTLSHDLPHSAGIVTTLITAIKTIGIKTIPI